MSALDHPDRGRTQDLCHWREQFADCRPIGEAQPRQRCVCVGVVRIVRLVPGKELDVTIEDGSGRLTATFTGRSRLPGLEMGSGLRVVGTVVQDGHGRRTMRNPDWSLVAEPYA